MKFTIQLQAIALIVTNLFFIQNSHAGVFNFTAEQNYENLGFGGLGNSPVQFKYGYESITASAYALVENNSANGFTNKFRRANLTRNASTGLGVNRFDDSLGQIDNQDNIDLILFDFGQASADPLSLVFSLVSANDNVSLWLGNGLEDIYANLGNSIDSFLDLNFNKLVSIAGFTQVAENAKLILNNPFDLSAKNFQYLVVAAPDYRESGLANDDFRLASLDVQDLPEPGVPALFLAALIAWTGVRRLGQRAE